MRIRIIMLLAILLGSCARVLADAPSLKVAIDLDIPPYIMDGASDGLEVAILKQALAGYRLDFIQVPFNQINTAVESGLADVAVSVVESDTGAYFSDYFISFENYAISHASKGFSIEKVADLAGHPVLTWQGADVELGPAFEAMYASGGPERANYIEIADLKDQVAQFWREAADIVVIDRNIFSYFSTQQGRSTEEASFHDIFPPASMFRVGFKDAATRDAFNTGLAGLCSSGEYGRLLEHYKIELRKSVCDN